MLIEAMSTIEITVPRGAEARLKRSLAQTSIRLRDALECLAYGLNRSIFKPGLWVLSLYWSNRKKMDRHLQSDESASLAQSLDKYGAGICFSSFSDFNSEEPAYAIR